MYSQCVGKVFGHFVVRLRTQIDINFHIRFSLVKATLSNLWFILLLMPRMGVNMPVLPRFVS